MDTILIVEDFKSTREWLCEIVKLAYPECDILTAANCQSAKALLHNSLISLSVIDMGLPDGSGIDLLNFIAEEQISTIPIIATIYDDEEHILSALRAGAQGYILKDSAEEKIVEQIKEISKGGIPMSTVITKRIFSYFKDGGDDSGVRVDCVEKGDKGANKKSQSGLADYNLTRRETEVLALLAKGLKSPEVATLLEIAPSTVAGYIKIIYQKLDVCSRAEAALIAKELGII